MTDQDNVTFKQKRRGRPKKIMDEAFIVRQIRNGFPVRKLGPLLGVHRDTLYANYKKAIKKGRTAAEAWQRRKRNYLSAKRRQLTRTHDESFKNQDR